MSLRHRPRLNSFVFLVLVLVATPLLACDDLPAELTGLGFDPTAVDVTSAPAPVTCSMTVTDDLAGVAEATCNFFSPTFLQSTSCTASAPSSGDRLSGTFTCDATIPQYAEAGLWTAAIDLTDQVGNETSLDSFTLGAQGFPSSVSVTSLSPDFIGPSLTNFARSPAAVNVSAAPATVTCDMSWSDVPAGVATSTCQLVAPDFFKILSCTSEVPSSGDRNNGTFSCDIEVPRYANNGTWSFQLNAQDQAGNVAFIDTGTLGVFGFPSTLAVTSSPEDLAGPSLDDFDFSPKSVDVNNGSAQVTCTMQVSDALAGTQFAACSLLGPDEEQAQGCFALEPSSGTRTNGTWTCTATIPRYSIDGVWKASVQLQDQARNLRGLTDAELAGAGFPTDLTVACDGGGSAEPSIRWNSKTELAWDPIADATRYNTYRGDLQDVAFDYGSCQNARDGNLTDTVFTDAETPLPGEGFHYLVSVTDGSGVEGGLGNASDGTPRSPSSPCP